MNPIKQKIKNQFDAASSSYEKVSQVQKHSANFLVKKLLECEKLFYPQTILDLGTGTGYIPELLIPHYVESFYTLNDIAPKMLAITQSKFAKYNNFEFCVGDMEHINFKAHDLIISNLALQWVSDLTATLQKIYKKSHVFAFSCLLDGTFYEWDDILKNYGLTLVLKKQPKLGNLVLFCKELGANKFYFEAKNFRLKFANAYSFMQYLKNLGAVTNTTNISVNGLRSLITKHKTEFEITYKVFFGIMVHYSKN